MRAFVLYFPSLHDRTADQLGVGHSQVVVHPFVFLSDFHLTVPVPPPVLRSRPYLVDFVSQLSAFCMCLQAHAQSEEKNKLTNAMFLDELPDLLDFCNNLSDKCIILADMNVHVDSPNNPCTAKLLSSFNMFFFFIGCK